MWADEGRVEGAERDLDRAILGGGQKCQIQGMPCQGKPAGGSDAAL